MAKIVVENPIKWYVLFNRNKNNFIVWLVTRKSYEAIIEGYGRK